MALVDPATHAAAVLAAMKPPDAALVLAVGACLATS